jgi:translation initiation factor IF-2
LVEKGELNRKDKAKVIRKGEVVCDSSITSLRHVKENVNKIVAGNECGITIADFVDFEVGDIIQSYKMVEKK